MGILSRASYVVRSKINAVLNRAEDPSETLDYSYERLRDELQDVKKGIADLTTQKKRLEIQKRRLVVPFSRPREGVPGVGQLAAALVPGAVVEAETRTVDGVAHCPQEPVASGAAHPGVRRAGDHTSVGVGRIQRSPDIAVRGNEHLLAHAAP